MNQRFFALAFALGLAAVAWVAWGFIATSWPALVMTAVIGATFIAGAAELRRWRAATHGLGTALANVPQPLDRLADWLEQVPAGLRGAVRARVEGERVALPGPALTPYLVGLLVMLGMLGTFLGMVATFRGALFALEGSADLQAIRAALAAPIKGLSLAFGTSVAGVAASAMLGLMSAIARRERAEVTRQLDTTIATKLRPFSGVHERQETFRALQAQARALPEAVERLDAVMQRMEQRAERLDAQLMERQLQFQREAALAYGSLATQVGASLQESVGAATRGAAESVRPVVEGAMAQLVQDAQRLHARLGEAEHTQAAALEAREQQRREDEARWVQQQGERMDALAALWRSELSALRDQEHQRGAAAVERLGELQAAVTQHLASLGTALEAPLTRLLQTASEVPQAAAGVITQLRAEAGRLAARDDLALQERTALLERFGTLLAAVEGATGEQRAAVDRLVASAADTLAQGAGRFDELLRTHAGQAADAAAHVAAGAIEMTALAEAFQQGVQGFQAGSDKLVETLQRIEGSLTRSTARSDEQLAYYVAQAREVIDLSLSSQETLLENLRQLQARPALAHGARA